MQLCTATLSSAKPAAPMSSFHGFWPDSFHVAVEVLWTAGKVDQCLLSWQAAHSEPFSSEAIMNLGKAVP